MQQNDFAREALRFGKIVGRHDNLDSAQGECADDLLDCFGPFRIKTRSRLIKKQHLRISSQSSCQGESLLFAAGKASCWPVCDGFQTDEAQQFNGAGSAMLSPNSCRSKCEMKVIRRATPKHHRTLEDQCPTYRVCASRAAPADEPP